MFCFGKNSIINSIKKVFFYDPGIFGLSLIIRITSYTQCIVFGTKTRFN